MEEVKQVGGDHYNAEYQHWDWSIDVGIGPIEYAATKYISRWRKKNGLQDVDKAISYMKKVRSAHRQGLYLNRSFALTSGNSSRSNMSVVQCTSKFLRANPMEHEEEMFMRSAISWVNVVDIDRSLAILNLVRANAVIFDANKAAQAPNG